MGINKSRITTQAIYFPDYKSGMEQAVYSFDEAMKSMKPLLQYSAILAGQTGYFTIVKIGNNLYKYSDEVKAFCRKLGAIQSAVAKSSASDLLETSSILKVFNTFLVSSGFTAPSKSKGLSTSRKTGGITFTFTKMFNSSLQGCSWEYSVSLENYNQESQEISGITTSITFKTPEETYSDYDVSRAQINGTSVFTPDFINQWKGYYSDNLVKSVVKTFNGIPGNNYTLDEFKNFVTEALKFIPSIEKTFLIDTTKKFNIDDNGVLHYYFSTTREDEITIPEGVVEISSEVFRDVYCKKVVFPKTLRKLGTQAFRSNGFLEEVKFSPETSSLTIGNQVFSNSSLNKITLPDCPITIERYAFSDCMSLNSIFLPKTVVGIADDAFAFWRHHDLTIYCETSEKPTGWDDDWLGYYGEREGTKVIWGASRPANESLTEDVDDLEIIEYNRKLGVDTLNDAQKNAVIEELFSGADDGRRDFLLDKSIFNSEWKFIQDIELAVDEFGEGEEASEFSYTLIVDGEPIGIFFTEEFFNEINSLSYELSEEKVNKNQLKDRAKKHKKSDKKGAKGWFVHPNAGNVEYNVSFFNRAMGSGDASSSGLSVSSSGASGSCCEEVESNSDLDIIERSPYTFTYSLANKWLTKGYDWDEINPAASPKSFWYARIPETCMKVDKESYKQNPLLKKRKNKHVMQGVKKFFDEHPNAKYCVIECQDERHHGKFVNTYKALMESLVEDIEKHETLNPKLWNSDNTLKDEVKEKIMEIVKDFTDGLEKDGIKFNLKDVKLVGSNCSYNYNKDSDLDIHLVMDTKSLECPDNLYPLLYSSYRSIWNKNHDIDFYGIPVEIFVETDDTVDLNNVVVDKEEK